MHNLIRVTRPLRALDLFAGAGGSSCGVRSAGMEPAAAIDLWDFATEVYRDNFPDATVVRGDLRSLSPKRLMQRIGRVDALVASPECTHHTCARGSAPRDETSRETALQVWRYAATFKPRWIVIENVVHMRRWHRHEEFKAALAELGYHVREQVLDATAFGVPQVRRRLFLVCDRLAPTSKVSATWKGDPKPAKRILDPRGVWKQGLLFTPTRAKETLRRYHRGAAKMGGDKPFLIVYYGTDGAGGWQPLDRPLRTVTTLDRFGLVEPSDDGVRFRMLQVPELRRAMGFPEEFKLERGSRREQIKVLGNAVCPPVMAAVLSQITSVSPVT
jgi:DNA (cytosine-5)-methyltransferase 1